MVFVSVVCPTFDRRRWLPFMLHQFLRFDWPRHLKELVVLDDSETSNADLFAGFEEYNIRYVHARPRMTIGQKRARLNGMALGDVIVCMDDDDVHHPQRLRHSVDVLRQSGASLAGSTSLYVYYQSTDVVRLFGPYHPTHGTHGTMAYTKGYASTHAYDPTVRHAEELAFTKHYTEPMAQLDPRRTILCIAHASNTFDKHQAAVIEGSRPTELTLRDFWT